MLRPYINHEQEPTRFYSGYSPMLPRPYFNHHSLYPPTPVLFPMPGLLVPVLPHRSR